MRHPSRLSVALIAVAILGAAVAATDTRAVTRSPYAGWQQRDIKALSDEQIQGLRAGRGMSLALAAELNRYPGPTHVLELADALALSADQRRQTEAVRGKMQAEAIRIGEAIIEKERELDRLFAHRMVDRERLRAAVAEIARLQGELRYTHLATHLALRRLLSPRQIARYDRLRGYSGGGGTEPVPGGHGGTGGHSGH